MKAPVKPKSPVKPTYPNKDVKVHKHEVSATNLFFDRSDFDDELDDELDDEDDCEYDHITHGKLVCPSIADLIKLVPPNTSLDNIFVEIDAGREVTLIM